MGRLLVLLFFFPFITQHALNLLICMAAGTICSLRRPTTVGLTGAYSPPAPLAASPSWPRPARGWHRAFPGLSMEAESCGKGPFLSVFCFVLFNIFSFVLVAFFVWSPPPPQEKAKRRGIRAANLTQQRDARHVKGGGESRCSLSAHK